MRMFCRLTMSGLWLGTHVHAACRQLVFNYTGVLRMKVLCPTPGLAQLLYNFECLQVVVMEHVGVRVHENSVVWISSRAPVELECLQYAELA